MKRIFLNAYLLGVLLVIIQGCGYHSPYANIGTKELETKYIYLTIWDNKTNELGFENQIYQKTVDWIQQSRYLKITTDKERANYLLAGTVESVNYPATAYSTKDVATTLKASVKISYHLISKSSGDKAWEVKNAIREQSYNAATDAAVPGGTYAVRSQSNKKAALAIIADEIAELVYLKTTDTLTTEDN